MWQACESLTKERWSWRLVSAADTLPDVISEVRLPQLKVKKKYGGPRLSVSTFFCRTTSCILGVDESKPLVSRELINSQKKKKKGKV
jgi:hypothetical protein